MRSAHIRLEWMNVGKMLCTHTKLAITKEWDVGCCLHANALFLCNFLPDRHKSGNFMIPSLELYTHRSDLDHLWCADGILFGIRTPLYSTWKPRAVGICLCLLCVLCARAQIPVWQFLVRMPLNSIILPVRVEHLVAHYLIPMALRGDHTANFNCLHATYHSFERGAARNGTAIAMRSRARGPRSFVWRAYFIQSF